MLFQWVETESKNYVTKATGLILISFPDNDTINVPSILDLGGTHVILF